MKIKLSDVKFKIGNNIISPVSISRLSVENGHTDIMYCDATDGCVKRIEMIVPSKDVEIIIPEVQEGKRCGY